MTRVRSPLAAVLTLALPLVLAGCCASPSSLKRTWSVRYPASPPVVAKAADAKPHVVGGTPAAAVAGAPDGWVAAPGVTVAGQPDEAAWAAYSAAGYRTIVNFRPPSEGADRERELVVANGMQYFNMPVVGPEVTWGAADGLAKILDGSANRRMLLHCSSGARVSGVWALYQARYHGLSTEAAIAEGQRVGPMKPVVEKRVRELMDGASPDCEKIPDCDKHEHMRAAAQ